MSLNSDQIFDIIRDISITSSKVEKEAMIRGAGADEDFRRVLVAMLDPFITYGIAKVPDPENDARYKDGKILFNVNVWGTLNGLAKREITGNQARSEVQYWMNTLTPKSAELFKRILTKKPDAGFSESTVNKAIPGLIPTFDCMLAHKFDAERIEAWPQIVEPKLDGVRVLAFVKLVDRKVNFFSRSGKEFTTFDHLKEPLLDIVDRRRSQLMEDAADEYDSLNLSDGEDTDISSMDALYVKHGVDELLEIVFDGEVVSGSFNKTVGDVRRKEEQAADARFNVFDVLPMSTFCRDDKKGDRIAGEYRARRHKLEALMGELDDSSPVSLLPRYIVNSVAEIHALYERVRERGLEGLIVKNPHGLYHRRRNYDWMKIKAEESVDAEIVGAVEGTGKYVGMLGAIIVDFRGNKVFVGSGLSDEQRQSFWKARLEGELVGRLIEVEYHEVTPDGSLRHPRFVRFRDDKLLEEAT